MSAAGSGGGELITVYVKTLRGGKIALSLNTGSDTVASLKAVIHDREGIPSDQLLLLLRSQALEPDSKPLSSFGLCDSDIIHLHLKQRSSATAPPASEKDAEDRDTDSHSPSRSAASPTHGRISSESAALSRHGRIPIWEFGGQNHDTWNRFSPEHSVLAEQNMPNGEFTFSTLLLHTCSTPSPLRPPCVDGFGLHVCVGVV